MAATCTKVFVTDVGDRYMSLYKVSLGSYATNGVAVTPANLGFASTTDDQFHVDVQGSSGYVAEYDHTNQKIKAYRQKDPAAAGGADIALPEVGNGVDLSGVTFRVAAYGRFRA